VGTFREEIIGQNMAAELLVLSRQLVREKGGSDAAEDVVSEALLATLQAVQDGECSIAPTDYLRIEVAKQRWQCGGTSLEYLLDERFLPESAMRTDWNASDYVPGGRWAYHVCSSCVGSGRQSPTRFCHRCGGDGFYEVAGYTGTTGSLKRLTQSALYRQPKELTYLATLWITKRMSVKAIGEHIGRSSRWVGQKLKQIEALLRREYAIQGHRDTQDSAALRTANDMIPCEYCGKLCRREYASRAVAFCNLVCRLAYKEQPTNVKKRHDAEAQPQLEAFVADPPAAPDPAAQGNLFEIEEGGD
jgi:hypothetical protein